MEFPFLFFFLGIFSEAEALVLKFYSWLQLIVVGCVKELCQYSALRR